MFSIRVFPSGPFVTNALVVWCASTKKSLIIDPAPGSHDAILSCVKEDELDPRCDRADPFAFGSHWRCRRCPEGAIPAGLGASS